MVSSVFHRSASEIFAHQSLSSYISPFLHAPTSSSVLVMSKGGMREDGGRGTLVSRGDNGSLLVRSDAQHSCEFLSLRYTHTSPFASSHLFKKKSTPIPLPQSSLCPLTAIASNKGQFIHLAGRGGMRETTTIFSLANDDLFRNQDVL